MTGPSRAPRGSYSKLKCIQCRTRKIKCVLPNLAIEPSDSPQPKETSCIRCQQQGLECVVDKTILGRPSHKRRRSQSGTTSLTEPDDSGDGHAHDVEHNEEDDDLQAFVLSHVQSAVDDIDRPMFPPKMAKPSRHEVFAALVDSTHLLSALLARDALFAVKTGLRMPDAPMEPVQLLSDELIFSMDKQLVWHRLHFPYLPTLLELQETFEPDARHAWTTQLLIALLALVALQRLTGHDDLQQKLWSYVHEHAQSLIFELPAHRHAMLFVDIASWCNPTVFILRQGQAAAAVKGSLTTTVGKQIAQELGFAQARQRLSSTMNNAKVQGCNESVESLVLDCLQWCRWLMLESMMHGFVIKPIAEQERHMSEIHRILFVVQQAMSLCAMQPSAVFLFHNLCRAEVEMQAAIDAKKNWLHLPSLSALIDTNARKCDELESYISTLLSSCQGSTASEEAKIIQQLQSTDLNLSHVRIGGVALFYGLMSGLNPAPSRAQLEARDITPEDAMQVSSEIIANLQSKPFSRHEAGSIAAFLTGYGDARFARLERALRDFISNAQNLRLDDVPYFPPAVPTVSNVLFICREMVENNATRLKGWGQLHPNVGVHLLLFQDVAKCLLTMSCTTEKQGHAVANGCIFAAGAKLVGSLGAILTRWRRNLAKKQVRDTAMANREKIETTRVESSPPDDCLQNLDDWTQWPQAEAVDFATLFADDADWLQWARDLLPTEEDLQNQYNSLGGT